MPFKKRMVKAIEGDDVHDEAPTFRDRGKAAGADASSAGSVVGLHASRKTVKKRNMPNNLVPKTGQKGKARQITCKITYPPSENLRVGPQG